MLAYLAAKFGGMRVLIVITYRSSELFLAKHAFLPVKLELQARGICRETPLEFLSREDVEKYLGLEFPGHHFPKELLAVIHTKTEGSPLFMVDLVRYLRDRQVIAEDQGRWVLAQALPDVERELPQSVRSMIQRKIDQLNETDRRLLIVASVQGYEFDSSVVSKALGVDAGDVEERLEVLDRVHGFVRRIREQEFPDRTIILRCRFVHVLYQNALYASLSPTRRISSSAAVALALISHYGQETAFVASELALLFEVARDFSQAAEYFRIATQHASHLYAHNEAIFLAQRGLQALKSLAETPERVRQEIELQLAIGSAWFSAKGAAATEADEAYSRATELCEALGEKSKLFLALSGIWGGCLLRADLKRARHLTEELLSLAQSLQDPGLLVIAHSARGQTLFYLGEFLGALEHFDQGIQIYDRGRHSGLAFVHGEDPGVGCLVHSSWALWYLGYPDRALRKSQEALALARDLARPFEVCYSLGFAARLHQLRGEHQASHELAEALIALSQEQAMAFWLAMGTLRQGCALADEGQMDAGIKLMGEGLNAWLATGSELDWPYELARQAEAYLKCGDLSLGLATVTEAFGVVAKNQERYYEAELHRLRGELLLVQGAMSGSGRSDAAKTMELAEVEPSVIVEVEACFRQATKIARDQSARSLELRAVTSLSRLLKAQGKSAEARGLLSEVYGWFAEGLATADLKAAAALLHS